MQFDWDGLIVLLAQNLYSEKRIFIRELVQNAHDAIRRRARGLEQGRIEITTNPDGCAFVIADNGIGMSRADLVDYLSTIGTGATRAEQGVPGLVGHFGIGFLSAFIVAEKVEVITRRVGEKTSWKWTNIGSREYEIFETDELSDPGTIVRVLVRSSEKGLIHSDEIKAVIEDYCDMLEVPIYLNNSRRPINRVVMPWEQVDIADDRLELDCRIYISEQFKEDALEIIPIRTVDTSGILYISRSRSLVVSAPRTVQVYLNRMFVSASITDLLPEWASFVNGVITSSSLVPTAARDNVARNDAFFALRETLGNIIIDHLDQLRRSNPSRFSEIQRFHTLGLKAACHHYDEFFDKFVDLLEWNTNELGDEQEPSVPTMGRHLRTLPEIVSLVQAREPTRQTTPLRCFHSANAANHFFAMARAANAILIDATRLYDLSILEKYVLKYFDEGLRLVRVDKDDDPIFFRPVTEVEEPNVLALAAFMSQLEVATNDGGSKERLTAVVRRFEPKTLTAVIRPGKNAADLEHAQQVLEDPNSPQQFRRLAESVLKGTKRELVLAINANNTFVKRLAQTDLENPEMQRLMLGLYNSAFLSSELMSTINAEILHRDLTYFLDRALTSIELEADIPPKTALDTDIAEGSLQKAGFVQFFMMVPYSPKYREIIHALRVLIEDRWFARLLLASDKKYEDRILDSVSRHMNDAAVFIAEVSEGNPNVMFELGAVVAQKRKRPIIQLASAVMQGAHSDRLQLPADLGGMIYVDYGTLGGEELITYLNDEFRKDSVVDEMISLQNREFFISSRRLQKMVGRMASALPDNAYTELSRRFPAESDWLTTDADRIAAFLPEGTADMADLLVKRVRAALS
jgi:HSP90 family molecular chaperone